MRVAIVHYHLAPGGVTRVIEHASSALTAAGIHHVILTGESIPGLGYLDDPGDFTAENLTAALRAAAASALGGPPDVWHFHNHSLGKNCLLPQVISRLAAENEALLLQLHDLAEQGRPANYPLIANIPDLYPFSPRIHYAFLNSRDLALFTNAGLPPANAVLLPNPISAPLRDPCVSAVHPLLFAPVRGIRRKNVGELILLATLAPPGTRVAISRAPQNLTALPIHENWRKFAAKHHLPIGFDVVGNFTPALGAGTDFDSWVAHATHFVTTSVSEGFGLTFLESIAHQKPLLGRNLPHLTADHAAHGISAGRLYDAILVPIEWVDISILRGHLAIDIERDHRLYQHSPQRDFIEKTLAAIVRNGLIDFGNLPEPLQQAIIEKLAEPASRNVPLIQQNGVTRPATDWLAETLAETTPTATPEQLAPYSLESYKKSITAIYSQLIAATVWETQHVSPAAILRPHLRPEAFHFLLSSLRPVTPASRKIRAVIFDIYGTLLIAPAGGVKSEPLTDPVLRDILRQAGYEPPASPSTELHAAVLRHHAAAGVPFPEIDLRVLWREILSLEPGTDITQLVQDIEAAWHPSKFMPGAEKFIQRLSRSGVSLGLLSNAQCNTLSALGGIADLFAPELTVLSYQLGIAKPSPALFQMLADRLAGRNITPAQTLYIGNDPLQDIIPAAAAGFSTALFTGHPDSLRPGDCEPDFALKNWNELDSIFR